MEKSFYEKVFEIELRSCFCYIFAFLIYARKRIFEWLFSCHFVFPLAFSCTLLALNFLFQLFYFFPSVVRNWSNSHEKELHPNWHFYSPSPPAASLWSASDLKFRFRPSDNPFQPWDPNLVWGWALLVLPAMLGPSRLAMAAANCQDKIYWRLKVKKFSLVPMQKPAIQLLVIANAFRF